LAAIAVCAKKTIKGFLPHLQLEVWLIRYLLPKHPVSFQSPYVSGTLLSPVLCPQQARLARGSFMMAIYRVTRVVYLSDTAFEY